MLKNGYAKIERGESKLNLDRLTQIAQAFDMDLVELINISEKGLICLFSENNSGIHYGNYYQGAETIAAENEKLQLIIAGVMDKTGAKKRRSPYAVRLSGVESL